MDAAQGNIREVCALRIRIKFRKYGVMKFIGGQVLILPIPKALARIRLCPLQRRLAWGLPVTGNT